MLQYVTVVPVLNVIVHFCKKKDVPIKGKNKIRRILES